MMPSTKKPNVELDESAAAPVTEGAPAWREKATRRTTAIYFKHIRELRLIKRAARALGVPFTRFIREASLQKANDVMEKAS
jgi:hypothetical protein